MLENLINVLSKLFEIMFWADIIILIIGVFFGQVINKRFSWEDERLLLKIADKIDTVFLVVGIGMSIFVAILFCIIVVCTIALIVCSIFI
jgi:putative flippase GtrA